MSMITVSLIVGTWYQVVELDDPLVAQFFVDSTDEVIAALEINEPDSGSSGYFCTSGINALAIPAGKSLWLKLTSGAADIIYSQYGGIVLSESLSAFARTDTIAVDEVVAATYPTAGFDDTPTDQLSYVGLIHTVAAGIAGTATLTSAVLSLQFAFYYSGKTYRIHGIEQSASITSGLSDYADLATGQTLTTQYVDFTVDSSGGVALDVLLLCQELLDDVATWGTGSPFQFLLSQPSGGATSGANTVVSMQTKGRASALYLRT